ncbi:MAG: FAD-dependent oxidoreductase [Mycobacteriales bacterium]
MLDAPERSAYDALRAQGMSDTVIDRFVRPFLTGVFLEDELATSSRFFDMVWRSFARGTQCVPATGMQAIPAQLASRLPAGVLRLGSPVDRLPTARAVVVATDPVTAGARAGTAVPAMRGGTTHYHLADEPPTRERAIVLDAERSGPVANSVVLTNVAPSYAPGRVLVSSSVVSGPADEPTVRAHLSRMYGADTSRWEHVTAVEVPQALPSMAPPQGRLRRPVRVRDGVWVCGDSRDSASIQGALVSGRRAATSVLQALGA